MKSRRLSACLWGLFLAFALTHYAAAQATISYALLNGTVTDEAGRTVAQATITVRSLDTNQTFTAVSNDAGFYAVPSLSPGRYELAVSSVRPPPST
jgi:protocatechuate 3,4-dioxygenase beta subunit